MPRLDSKGSVICAGLSSILFIIAFNWYLDDFFPGNARYDFVKHITIVHALSSICLIVGAIKDIYKLFVPWMITTIFFMYYMVLAFLQSLHTVNIEFITIDVIIVLVGVYLCFALYGVKKAFDALRNLEPPSYNYLNDKTNFAYHI